MFNAKLANNRIAFRHCFTKENCNFCSSSRCSLFIHKSKSHCLTQSGRKDTVTSSFSDEINKNSNKATMIKTTGAHSMFNVEVANNRRAFTHSPALIRHAPV